MKTSNFQNLIQLVTGRDFSIATNDENLNFDTEYRIFKTLPVSGRIVSFSWKTPKADEKMLRSFITAFTSKYREPNPEAYNYNYGGKTYRWDEKNDEEKEFAYMHHASNMYSKAALLNQVETNFSKETFAKTLLQR